MTSTGVNYSAYENAQKTPRTVLYVFLTAIVGVLTGHASQRKAFAQFVTDNGWHYDDSINMDDVASSLLGQGYDRQVGQGISGNYQGVDFRMGVYAYITGQGRNREIHNFTTLHIKTTKQFPYMLIDSLEKLPFWTWTEEPEKLPTKLAGAEQLQLEGDFNDHFKVMVMPGTERDVLQFLTPDFMAELLDAPAIGIELEAGNLYIIFSGSAYNEKSLRAIFAGVDIALKQLKEVSGSWQASSSPESIQLIGQTATEERGRLLNRKYNKHIIITTIVLIIFVIANIAALLIYG